MRATALLLPPPLAGAGNAITEPKPPSSLPRSTSVMEPPAGLVGNIGTMRVGPTTAARVGVAGVGTCRGSGLVPAWLRKPARSAGRGFL
jgi:hypothetical protein